MGYKRVRKANGLDVGQLTHLLIGWLEETEFEYPGYCEYSPLWLADFIYRHPTFVGEVDGKIVGAIGLKSGSFPWNNEVACLFCDFLMVDKEYRGNGVATMLIDEAKKLADQNDVSLHLGLMTGNKAELKDRFLEISGFMYAGGNFVYK